MKRGVFVLVTLVVLGVAAAWLAHCLCHQQEQPLDWLRKEFSLSADQTRQVEVIDDGFQKQCAGMCADIDFASRHEAVLIRSSSQVTPEIRAAIIETDRVRTECRLMMLEHFYKVAATMPADQREHYLQMVLPLVLDPSQMKPVR